MPVALELAGSSSLIGSPQITKGGLMVAGQFSGFAGLDLNADNLAARFKGGSCIISNGSECFSLASSSFFFSLILEINAAISGLLEGIS